MASAREHSHHASAEEWAGSACEFPTLPKSGQAPQNPTGKIRGCPDNREPLAEVIALSHLCPHLRMHVEVFGPITEERAGTSKSYWAKSPCAQTEHGAACRG